jgi:hypothetical protein
MTVLVLLLLLPIAPPMASAAITTTITIQTTRFGAPAPSAACPAPSS